MYFDDFSRARYTFPNLPDPNGLPISKSDNFHPRACAAFVGPPPGGSTPSVTRRGCPTFDDSRPPPADDEEVPGRPYRLAERQMMFGDWFSWFAVVFGVVAVFVIDGAGYRW